MEKETKEHKLRMIAHDIKNTLAVLENAFNGVIENPSHKEDYRNFFDKGIARVRGALEQMKKLGEGSDE